MKSPEIVVVSAIAALLLAGGVNFARGKQDVVVEGVAVQQNLVYDFYPNAKDCATKGTSYLLLPNAGFSDAVGETTDADHLDRLFHSTWKLKIRGDLSRIGRFGVRGRDSREFTVRSVIDAQRLECGSGPHLRSSN